MAVSRILEEKRKESLTDIKFQIFRMNIYPKEIKSANDKVTYIYIYSITICNNEDMEITPMPIQRINGYRSCDISTPQNITHIFSPI